jgi:aryl-alcohol dehydrogenase-like predicted oxidoreductase
MAIMTRTLGRTRANVTVLGYGAMELRGLPRGPEITGDDAGRLLNAVLDGGINLIDTSPDYGRSEELIGAHVGHRREEYFLASKCGCPMKHATNAPPRYPHDYSQRNVRANVDQSLRRLRGWAGWSSSCASPSATRACPPPSSAPQASTMVGAVGALVVGVVSGEL